MKYKFKQYAVVQFNNCGPDVRLFQSNREIKIGRVAEHLAKNEGFNEDVDSLTFVGVPTKEKV